ncbi:hypothetical protein C8R45DRAFT_1148060 [Mycena sanguinolenta]|nr:hypothetical protein C8R45DRAFT_1148060 [Mycena sanguinolenta]
MDGRKLGPSFLAVLLGFYGGRPPWISSANSGQAVGAIAGCLPTVPQDARILRDTLYAHTTSRGHLPLARDAFMTSGNGHTTTAGVRRTLNAFPSPGTRRTADAIRLSGNGHALALRACGLGVEVVWRFCFRTFRDPLLRGIIIIEVEPAWLSSTSCSIALGPYSSPSFPPSPPVVSRYFRGFSVDCASVVVPSLWTALDPHLHFTRADLLFPLGLLRHVTVQVER